ncbi:MAG: usg protein [Alphaproteobacteria bacterium]|nr:usg protein [Alphaproteobacteria bacterium]
MAKNEREDFEKMVRDYRLTTAEILYHMPDHPKLLQSFVWQELDLAPKFPVLTKFIDFWNRELDGKIHSVTVAHTELIKPSQFQFIRGLSTIH